ncbi:HDIG domain-containing protein [Desulfovibrio sulfodismutans]|uniref:HDIG domain-containing protein n=1 Tax=Desulfolutivibrio sulfodismutans TaxID=63561 RepID=A0A7K3NMW3_9BACT|nr:HDIG domain-containing protein [Desulfolutivibrio sulfodismutans]QLA11949.1 HDIG domain-containing protein [Desulfolutivibrio sulfodismutans DSM 3696]
MPEKPFSDAHSGTSPESRPEAMSGAYAPVVSFVPTTAQCLALWDAYDMLPNIRSHSLTVACIAETLARSAAAAGLPVDVDAVRAAALLHDLAKTYTIRHGGNHSQLGGAWVQELTGNPALAQGVIHHVHWPFSVDIRAHFLPLIIIYSDKRVKHNRVVSLTERFEDLLHRYGATPDIRQRIGRSFAQAREIEDALIQTLGFQTDADIAHCRGLVE